MGSDAEDRRAGEVTRRAVTKAAGAASLAAFAAGILPPLISPSPALAKAGREPLGGQPPMGSTTSVKDFDYQIKYQRAFEAVLWNMPAIAIYSFRRAAFTDLGMKDNDIIAYSATASAASAAFCVSVLGSSVSRKN